MCLGWSGSLGLGYECRVRREKVLIRKDHDGVLHPLPFPAPWHLWWNAQGHGQLAVEGRPARELCGRSCGVQQRGQVESWNLSIKVEDETSLLSSSNLQTTAKFCSSWFQVRWQFHSLQAVFIKFVWFRFWQNSRPKLQNLFGLSLHPKGIGSRLEPGIYSSTLGQIKDSQGQKEGQGRKKNKSFPTSFCQGY